MPTAGVSLVREHTEHIHPPRTLWVPFELGRPFGPANEPAFRTAVLRSLLGLFEKPSGPIIEDYPIDAPRRADEDELWACPLPLPPLARP